MKKRSKNKIALVFGTRPEIVKLSALIRLLQRKKKDYFLIHTGQHYSYEMDQQFFEELKLPAPKWKFTRSSRIGPNMHSELVASMEDGIARVLEREKPSAVLVQGDTDTVLAGALAAKKVGGITIGHVEAGLRSYDKNMPEERNRIRADELSDILFAPTESARKNLIKEKFGNKRIEVTGNTVVDALLENLEIARKRADKNFGKKNYALVTLHRPESVDNKKRLVNVVQALEKLAQEKKLTIIFPVHPRTRQRLHEHGISLKRKGFSFVKPMGFLDFIWHEKNAALVLTDSGGVQEEACILKVPCVTIRTTTERPETVAVGSNLVAGYDPERILFAARRMMEKKKKWSNPFGDGRASERILKIIETSS